MIFLNDNTTMTTERFKNTSRQLVMLFLALLAYTGLTANNILVSNATTTKQGTAADTAIVQFDISWENSWRTSSAPNNWDAAWVFVKFRVGESDPTFTGVSSSGTTVTVSSTANLRVGMPVVVTSGTGAFDANTVISSITNDSQFVVSKTITNALSNATIACRRIWEHASLDTTDAKHTAPAGSTIKVPNDSTGVGAFIYRSGTGSGTFSLSDVGLVWKYGSNGLADDARIQIKVFAIEMVYVATGTFTAGDYSDLNDQFISGFPYATRISTGNATSTPTSHVENQDGSLTIGSGGYPEDQTAPDNASWPNGYNAFYCMKYELSQGQYRDFLNTLTYTQQDSLTASIPESPPGTGALDSLNGTRHGIDIQIRGTASTQIPAVYGCNLDGDGNFNESDDGEWIACNFITWVDGSAYSDWAGLRPMTELEYEKACRGPNNAVLGEFAWGTTSGTSLSGLSNGGADNEVASNSGASRNWNYASGPVRVGSFGGGSTSRTQAGAGYWGMMELTGNLWEQAVTIENSTGRAYTGLHGDGSLSANGFANVTAWPGLSSGEVKLLDGGIQKGGGFNTGTQFYYYGTVSSKRTVALFTGRQSNYGYRAVRTAP